MGWAGEGLLASELEVDFVNQCGGLKGLAWWELAKAVCGQGAEVLVDLFDED